MDTIPCLLLIEPYEQMLHKLEVVEFFVILNYVQI